MAGRRVAGRRTRAWRPSAPMPAPRRVRSELPLSSYMLGAGKYGLTQLRNLALLPPTGAVLIASPLADRRRLRQPGARGGTGRTVMTAAEAVGITLAGLGDSPRLRCGRLGQLPRDECPGRRRRSFRRRKARGRGGDDGRRLRADERHGRRAHRAPGLRADQRDDRHHRGGEEPHAAGRACRRVDRQRSNFYVDQDGWPSPSVRSRCGSTAAEDAVADAARAYHLARDDRRTVVLNLPLAVQATKTAGRRGCQSSRAGHRRHPTPLDWPSSSTR